MSMDISTITLNEGLPDDAAREMGGPPSIRTTLRTTNMSMDISTITLNHGHHDDPADGHCLLDRMIRCGQEEN